VDFRLKDEHLMVQKLFREFANNEVKPIAQEIDENHRFPVETVAKMQKLGFLGIPFSREYGGQGCDFFTYVLAMEEISKVCTTTASILSAHTSLAAMPIDVFGTIEQKEKFLRPLVSGEKLGAFGLTESEAGTDAANQQTTAILDGDEYVLNGNKIFITNAGPADIYIVIAVTNRALGRQGISAFIVEKNIPGFEIGHREKKMGIRASATSELIFTDCRIPKENLLGGLGHGYKIAISTLDSGRIGIAAQAVGIAAGALEKTVEYVNQRKQFGRPIAKFQNTQFTIADMATEVEAARMLVYKAAYAKSVQKHYSLEAAMAKLKASEVASYVTNRAVQLHGGYGFIQDYDVERMMRDAKITEIYEGTSEVMRMVVGSTILG